MAVVKKGAPALYIHICIRLRGPFSAVIDTLFGWIDGPIMDDVCALRETKNLSIPRVSTLEKVVAVDSDSADLIF